MNSFLKKIVLTICLFSVVAVHASQTIRERVVRMIKSIPSRSLQVRTPVIKKVVGIYAAAGGITALIYGINRFLHNYTPGQRSIVDQYVNELRNPGNKRTYIDVDGTRALSAHALIMLIMNGMSKGSLLSVFAKINKTLGIFMHAYHYFFGAHCLYILKQIMQSNVDRAMEQALRTNNINLVRQYRRGLLGLLKTNINDEQQWVQAIESGSLQIVQLLLPHVNIVQLAQGVTRARALCAQEPANQNRQAILKLLTDKQENAAKAVGQYLSRQPAVHPDPEELSKEHAAHREQLKENLSAACDQPLTDGKTQLPKDIALQIGALLTGAQLERVKPDGRE